MKRLRSSWALAVVVSLLGSCNEGKLSVDTRAQASAASSAESAARPSASASAAAAGSATPEATPLGLGFPEYEHMSAECRYFCTESSIRSYRKARLCKGVAPYQVKPPMWPTPRACLAAFDDDLKFRISEAQANCGCRNHPSLPPEEYQHRPACVKLCARARPRLDELKRSCLRFPATEESDSLECRRLEERLYYDFFYLDLWACRC